MSLSTLPNLTYLPPQSPEIYYANKELGIFDGWCVDPDLIWTQSTVYGRTRTRTEQDQPGVEVWFVWEANESLVLFFISSHFFFFLSA